MDGPTANGSDLRLLNGMERRGRDRSCYHYFTPPCRQAVVKDAYGDTCASPPVLPSYGGIEESAFVHRDGYQEQTSGNR